jgi:solute carrier family 25 protein 44
MGYRDDIDKKPSHLEMVTVQAMAGTVAGACSSIITTPMDTIKTRLQVCSVSYYHSLFLLHYYVHRRRNYLFFSVQILCCLELYVIFGVTLNTRILIWKVMDNYGSGRPSVLKTTKTLLKEDGWRGFYRGFGPRFLNMSLYGTTMIVTYELISMSISQVFLLMMGRLV